MNNDDRDNQIPCCPDSSCCSPTSANSGRSAKWKTIVFLSVMILAGAVATYAWFLKDDATAASACCPGGTAANGATCAPATPGALSANGGITLYLLIQDSDMPPTAITDMLTSVSDKIAAQGPRPMTVTLYPVDPAFPKIAEQHHVTKFPAVVASAPTDGLVLVGDEIGETPILTFCEKNAAASSGCASTATQTAATDK